ncbi:hypothetical protein RCL1_000849 [Eukaryota sp. TZLM3-RCL]
MGVSCKICGASNFLLTDLGYYVCRLCGTQVEHVSRVETSEFDVNTSSTIGIKTRKSDKKKQTTTINTISTKMIIEGFQIVLQLQSEYLIKSQSFPQEYNTILSDIWFRYLELASSMSSRETFGASLVINNSLCFHMIVIMWLRLPFTPIFLVNLANTGEFPFYHARKLLPAHLRLEDLSFLYPTRTLKESDVWDTMFSICKLIKLTFASSNSMLYFSYTFPSLGLPDVFLPPLLRLCSFIEAPVESFTKIVHPAAFSTFMASHLMVVFQLIYGLHFQTLDPQKTATVHISSVFEQSQKFPPFSVILDWAFDVLQSQKANFFQVQWGTFLVDAFLERTEEDQSHILHTFKHGFFACGWKGNVALLEKWIAFFEDYQSNNPPTTLDPTQHLRVSPSEDSVPTHRADDVQDPSYQYVSYSHDYNQDFNCCESPPYFILLLALSTALGAKISMVRKFLRSLEVSLKKWTGRMKQVSLSKSSQKLTDHSILDILSSVDQR